MECIFICKKPPGKKNEANILSALYLQKFFNDGNKKKINRTLLGFIFTFCGGVFWGIRYRWRVLLDGIAFQRNVLCHGDGPDVIFLQSY